LLTFVDRSAAAGYRFLAEAGVNAPAGTFYAYETSQRLGLGAVGGLRVGVSPYNNDEDVDRLLAALAQFVT
jgi:selenocysteine lyase/cysteine desulfurase